MDFIGIIPSRYGSSRFPGKPLAMIAGEPMIVRVCCRAARALSRIVVATDDQRIAEAVGRAGFEYVITPAEIPNGTVRCQQAARLIPHCPDIIINIQGDEPMIHPDDILAAAQALCHSDADIATLASPAASDRPDIALPNRVKVVVDNRSNALYFSRAPIPYIAHPSDNLPATPYLIHKGIYAFRRHTLDRIATMPPSELSTVESLEQLTWLQAGMKIRVAISRHESFGIDTPDDLATLQQMLNRQ